MNKAKFFLFGSFLFFMLPTMSGQTPADEYMAISETLSYYLDGGTNNDFTRLSKAFHKDATMKQVEDVYKAVNALDFFKKGMKPGPPANRTTKIVSINFKGKAANAVLHIDYPTSRIWDFMNLLKIDGKWQIVSKIFSKEEKDETSQIKSFLSKEEQEVLAVLHRWKMGYINRDATEVENILADNWTYAGGADGRLGNKKGAVEGTKNSKAEWLAVEFKNLITRKIGDVVIISGQEVLKIRENGQVNDGHLRFTDVFQKIDGQWQAVSTHSSEIK